MSQQEKFDQLIKAVVEGNQAIIKDIAHEAIDEGLNPLIIVEQGLSKGLEIIGTKFETGEVFLPELLLAADTFQDAMDIVKPAIEASKQEMQKLGTFLLATVKGDVHNIGKDIVATVVETSGFEVVDIGTDQSTLNIIEAAEKHKADIIGLSSVMTTTMPNQKELIDTLTEMGLRKNYFVLLGGGPVTQKWANDIGADGYGETAMDAVKIGKQLLQS